MRKFTKVGTFERIHEYTAELLQMQGKNSVEEIEELDARKFLSKTVLAMGNIDTDFLKEIITRARTIVYIGNDQEVKDVIIQFAAEKDIPQMVDNSGLSYSIQAWYNPQKTFEIYSSDIFSEMELANKYLMNTGPNFGLLVKYISQIELVRNTAVFDHDNFDDLKLIYSKFSEYHDNKTMAVPRETYDEQELLDLFNEYRPL